MQIVASRSKSLPQGSASRIARKVGTEDARTPQTDESKGFSVADLTRRWKIGTDKVHGFIRRGELVAVNVAANLSGRPQWRISLEAVQRFEQKRSSTPPSKPQRQRRRAGVVDFYPD